MFYQHKQIIMAEHFVWWHWLLSHAWPPFQLDRYYIKEVQWIIISNHAALLWRLRYDSREYETTVRWYLLCNDQVENMSSQYDGCACVRYHDVWMSSIYLLWRFIWQICYWNQSRTSWTDTLAGAYLILTIHIDISSYSDARWMYIMHVDMASNMIICRSVLRPNLSNLGVMRSYVDICTSLVWDPFDHGYLRSLLTSISIKFKNWGRWWLMQFFSWYLYHAASR